MSSNLNSILIEGTVVGGAELVKVGGAKSCSLIMCSLCCFKRGEAAQEQEIRIRIMIRDPGMVDAAIAHARDGRGIRVVGRIAYSKDDGVIYIEAEHVEYRPETKGKNK
jgi:hypothetical protein